MLLINVLLKFPSLIAFNVLRIPSIILIIFPPSPPSPASKVIINEMLREKMSPIYQTRKQWFNGLMHPAVDGRESVSSMRGGIYAGDDDSVSERLGNARGNPGRTREDLFGIVPLEASASSRREITKEREREREG